MKKLEIKTRKLLRAIFGSISVTAVAFAFQACYGMESDEYSDIKFKGTVLSKTTNLPIKGIKVTINEGRNHEFTNENGEFEFFASVPQYNYLIDKTRYTPDSVRVNFFDIDGIENGYFADTTIIINALHKDEVVFNVKLTEIIHNEEE